LTGGFSGVALHGLSSRVFFTATLPRFFWAPFFLLNIGNYRYFFEFGIAVVQSFGIDPVAFGLILCIVVTMGNMTPPVGLAMHVVCGILHCPLEDYIKACLPFVLAVLAEAALFTLFPNIVLFLPNLIYKINIPRGRATRYVVLIRYLYSDFIPL
jgi:TRAP-type mannitol/chloroaromatic compound transport system permease large subunit